MSSFLIGLLSSCLSSLPSSADSVGGLAYNRSRSGTVHTIWLKEEDGEAEYCVVESGYCGTGTLLVRKNALPIEINYNEESQLSGYYPDSTVDRYLNGEWYASLPEETRQRIMEVPLPVTSLESYDYMKLTVITIPRRVFSLSRNEVCGPSSVNAAKEGKELSFFLHKENRVLLTDDGTPVSWWLRTPNVSEGNFTTCVTEEGSVEMTVVNGLPGPSAYRRYLRPAFCIPSDTPVVSVDGNYYPASRAG